MNHEEAKRSCNQFQDSKMTSGPSTLFSETAAGMELRHPELVESSTLASYRPPGSLIPQRKDIEWVYNPSDGSVLLDHKGNPISVDKLLSTKPLRHELSSRPGPGGKKLTYISGEGVSRTLNDIFGFDGWNLDITKVQREECLKDKGKYTVVYTAMVRLTHKKSGTYKEDCGAGDSTDKCFATAVAHAMKGSITDAMKRAARHFGDKLGNSLYQGNFSINKAPTTLKDALDRCDIDRANSKFGFPKDQVKPPPTRTTPSSAKGNTNMTTQPPNNHKTSMANPQTRHRNSNQAPAHTNYSLPNATNHILNTCSSTGTGGVPVPSNPTQTPSSIPSYEQPNPNRSEYHNALQGAPMSVTQASVPLAEITPKCNSMPPPTAADVLLKSSLFVANPVGSEKNHRPNTSNGRKRDGNRRISTDSELPYPPAPLVTPMNSSSHAGNKRPNFDGAVNVDPTAVKKPNVNPYFAR